MTEAPYELAWSRTARRSIAEHLPETVALGAVEFITGPLVNNPHRLGKPLGAELAGIHSARLMRSWRVLYEIDEAQLLVTVLDIRRRADAYRSR